VKVEAAAPATTKNVANPNFNGTTNQEATEDDVVDQELEAADSADRGVPEQSVTESKVQKAMDAATEAQEEVDRAWAAEKRHRNEADSKAAELSKEAAPHTISAHKLPPESHDHRTRVDDVDRAAASLDEPNSEAEKNGTAVSSGISGLREWDSKGRMSEYEAYAVLDGQLHLVGPADLGGTRWMMRMSDAEEHFAQLQNARLYIADVQAEYSTTAELNSPLDAAIGNEAPGGGHYLHINDKCPKGICGRLLFCALEL